ncbi:MAG TPA: glycosyltransferase family 1 protein [Candidatus Angelobacter sp.]|nr:glycosyltransferase family 1 protein [Candidatus Angelobacter sp.]
MSATMKVAFDTAALKSKYRNHGVQVYAKNLLQAMRSLASRYDLELMPFVSASEDGPDLQSEPGFQPRKAPLLKFDRLWRYGGAAATAFSSGADIIFSPNAASLPINALVPTVTTIHDVTPMVMPYYLHRINLLLKFLVSQSARSSAAIITVSEHSKRDLVRICGVPESKVHVIYESCDCTLFNGDPPAPGLLQTTLSRWKIKKPYILHHGAIQPRKNLIRLIEAYRQVLARNRNLDCDLVLAGPFAWQYEEVIAAARTQGERGRVILTGALSDAELAMLLKGAVMEVISSLYEGFCLPMVEAMACGVPTIAANNSCLPEISGGELRYFDPYSVEEMAALIREVLLHPDLRTELAQRGQAYVQRYNWQLCAEETLTVLAKVARHGSAVHQSAGVAV